MFRKTIFTAIEEEHRKDKIAKPVDRTFPKSDKRGLELNQTEVVSQKDRC